MRNIFLLLMAVFLVCACNTETAPEVNIPVGCESDAIEIVTDEEQAEAVSQFGIDLLQTINTNSDENIVLSPLSIYSALLLVYEGSACETKKQIMRTLRLREGNNNAHAQSHYLTLMQKLTPSSSDTRLSFANALFSDPNKIDLSEHYQSDLIDGYEAEISELDFTQDSAVLAINKWAEDNTEGKIKKVLEKIDAAEVAFLLNAIYFKGDWLSGFLPQATSEKSFTLKDGSTVDVPMMSQTGSLHNFKDDAFQLVDLAVKGEDYAVSFIAPSETGASHIDAFISDENFVNTYNDLLNKVQNSSILLSLPKFELKGKEKLNDILIALGMKDAFDEEAADLSGIGAAGGNLFISRVLHDTYLKVDEKGIEGAAVTTVGVGANSVPPSLSFNKPFVFILRHVETGVPVFMGKVENPNG